VYLDAAIAKFGAEADAGEGTGRQEDRVDGLLVLGQLDDEVQQAN